MVTPTSMLLPEYSGLTLHKSEDQPPADSVENQEEWTGMSVSELRAGGIWAGADPGELQL